MKIKNRGHPKSILNKFDLLGNDEAALSKAFAFLIGKEPIALFSFLQSLNVPIKNTKNNFRNISIEIEKYRKEGRTDIEILYKNKFHVIIESKIKSNRIKEQKNQYKPSFDPDSPIKILCFITKEHDINKQKDQGIEIINLSWFDIANHYDNKNCIKSQLIQEFLHFIIKNFKMNEQKEILIQDLSNKYELRRFKDFNIYRRDQTFGSPLYFAPYFTRQSKQLEGEGIPYLAKILGILTLNPDDIDNYENDLLRFYDNKETVDNWKEGVRIITDYKDEQSTFYFLDKPLRLNKNLVKDGTIKKGRGKGWIAAMIPKNRCVTFTEFLKRLMD
jgi:hypothetical protein